MYRQMDRGWWIENGQLGWMGVDGCVDGWMDTYMAACGCPRTWESSGRGFSLSIIGVGLSPAECSFLVRVVLPTAGALGHLNSECAEGLVQVAEPSGAAPALACEGSCFLSPSASR